MNRRLALTLVIAAAILITSALLLRSPRPPARQEEREVESTLQPDPVQEIDKLAESAATARVVLYFPGEESKLYPEPRLLPEVEDPRALGTLLVNELLAGPQSGLLPSGLPADVTLGSFHLTEEGVAFVDLRSSEHATPPVTGSTAEMLTLYSLVHTLVENVQTIGSVVILWNGRQPPTFGGHIDTSRPLRPDLRLVSS